MKIQTLASGSGGNAYLVCDGETTLLLECGLCRKKLSERSGYGISRVDACLVTHEHQDHARAVRELLRSGIPVFCSEGTARALGIYGEANTRAVLRHKESCQIGTFTVLPVSVCHDAAEPLGFFLASAAGRRERLVFLTDTSRADFVFPAAEHILIECNHMGAQSMADTNAFLAGRVLQNHLGLAGCIAFLQRQDLGRIQDIRLIHISRAHGDPDMMRRAAAAATGRHIIVCGEKGE